MAKSEKSEELEKGDIDGKWGLVSSVVQSPQIFQGLLSIFFFLTE